MRTPALATATLATLTLAGALRAERVDAFTLADDHGRTYDARVTFPDPDESIGVTVLMLGGGSVTDRHWTVPGSVEWRGERIPLTIDDRPTRDADDIAGALLDRGFAVAQWSSIHRQDEPARENPGLATAKPYRVVRDLSERALAAVRAREGVDADRIALVAHSLGAARGLQLAADDDGVIAAAFLAGAYTSPLESRPSEAGEDVIGPLRAHGLSADEGIPRGRWERLAAADGAPRGWAFDEVDRDGDGFARRWEIASLAVVEDLAGGDRSALVADDATFAGGPHPARVLLAWDRPTLLIFGGLDPMSVHAPIIEAEASRAGADHVEVWIEPLLGHQLAPEVPRADGAPAAMAGPTLVGPIDPEIVERLAVWLAGAVGGETE